MLPDSRIADWAMSQVARVSAQQDAASRQSTADLLTFFDSVAVTATLRPAPVREIPGMVTVVDSEVIQARLFENLSDLVKYERCFCY